MLSIRLKGVGKKHQRSYRLVIQERRSKLVGHFIEDIGWYNPREDKFEVNAERAKYWLSVGAQPSLTIANVFKKSKIALPEFVHMKKIVSAKSKKAVVPPKAPSAAEAPAGKEAVAEAPAA